MPGTTEDANLEALQPAAVWRFFRGIAATPRPSKHEEKIRAHVRQVAHQLELALREDKAGNIVLDVPATPGHESAPVTILQGHLDMVCEKNAGTEIDFENDPIRLQLGADADSGEPVVRAAGTTLGADNGIGVAMALAAATEPDVVHGPLEILLTSDEEMGMTGAKALDAGFLRGRRLINLDTEEDDTLCIGCAGGCDSTLAWPLDAEPLENGCDVVRVSVTGLRGGHSGGDIHLNGGNAIKILTQVLRSIPDGQVRIIDLAGGSKRNAIPREAHATVAGSAGFGKVLAAAIRGAEDEVRSAMREPECRITVESPSGERPTHAATTLCSERLLLLISALPSGVLAIVPEMPGLVQTSSNVSTATTCLDSSGRPARVEVGCLSRSAAPTQMKSTVRQISAIARLAGAAVEIGNEYPGWQPDPDSALLAVCSKIYEREFGEPAHVVSVHGGLECGIIGERIGGMEMVSFGPTIKGAHSPDERVFVRSVKKSWSYLKAVLAELAAR